MRIGYLFRGFTGDIKLDRKGNEVSTPDGNATYSWCIEAECNRRRHQIIPLGEDLDGPAVSLMGENAFMAFSQKRRVKTYERMHMRGWGRGSSRKFPNLDLLLIEWRWPIPGRNTIDDRRDPAYQRDLERQEEVLRHYSNIPIVVWDLDHKLTADDEERWSLKHVIETAVRPRKLHVDRTRVHPPTIVSELLQYPIDARLPLNHLGYIGSRYERDDVIDEWIAPIAPLNSHRVRFWGKWEPADECAARWPGINFEGRIGVGGFRAAYSRVACVPLLAKRSYLESGFVTPRIAEAIMFGSIPIGLGTHHGISEYVELVANDPVQLMERATYIRTINPERRAIFREEAAHRLSHTDARHFVDVLEGLAR